MDYDRFNIHCSHCGAYHDDPRRCPNCGERVPREEVEAPSQRDYYGRGTGYYPYAPSYRDREYGSYGDESSPVKKGIAIGVVALLIVAILGVGVYFGFVKDGGLFANKGSGTGGTSTVAAKLDQSKLTSSAISNKEVQASVLEIPDGAFEFYHNAYNCDIGREDFVNALTIAKIGKSDDEYRGYYDSKGIIVEMYIGGPRTFYGSIYLSEDLGKYIKEKNSKASELIDEGDFRFSDKYREIEDTLVQSDSKLNNYYSIHVQSGKSNEKEFYEMISEYVSAAGVSGYDPMTEKPIEIQASGGGISLQVKIGLPRYMQMAAFLIFLLCIMKMDIYIVCM